MLSAAIIVFREVFEIVLIVGIILAATRTVPNRMTAVLSGFAAGLVGAGLIAVFTGEISALAEGVGQEYFNAGILLTAAAFIGWTVLWMKKHGRHMKKHFQEVGQAVTEGRSPYFALSAVIALTMLREGSEIVLFIYGMLAAGQAPLALAAGSTLGLVGGLIVGLALYFGLIKLSIRIFFQVTSLLLVLLVAGMASKAFGFLVAAGDFSNLSQTLWDTSGILSEQGLIGKSFGTLVGYTARPAAIQVIVYVLTLASLIGIMKMIDKNISFTNLLRGAAAGAILLIAFSGPARAVDHVTSPYVDGGELELEWKGQSTNDDNNDTQDGFWQQQLSAAYGFTDRFQLEVEGEAEHQDDETDFTAVALESKIQLTERGQYWVDVGVKGEYEVNTQDGPDEIQGKLLLGKDMGQFSHKANVNFTREIGSDASEDTNLGVTWSSRYRYNQAFEPGFEFHNNFGALTEHEDWDEQSHKLGPVVYGKIGPVKYDVGYLFGISDGAPDGTLRAVLEYEIPLRTPHTAR